VNKYAFIILPVLILFIPGEASPCTAFMAVRNKKVLIGRNEDSKNLESRMLVLPPFEGKNGVIFLGQQGKEGGRGAFIKVQGMNDRGLWYGSTALWGEGLPERRDIQNYHNKPIMPYDLITYIMENCSRIDEVIELFETYYYPSWKGHHLFVDEDGNSVIVEFGEKDVVFIRRSKDYQVMANNPLADPSLYRWYNDYRYEAATSMLKNSNEISIDLFRLICDEVHQEGSFPTGLSTIYDVKNREFYLYYFHNYEEFLRFNVDDEMQKEENYYNIPELYNQLKLTFPINDEQVSKNSVTFSWNGNARNYLLYYSTDPDFQNAKPIEVSDTINPVKSSLTLFILVIGVLLFGTIGIKKRESLAVIYFILISFIVCCEETDTVDPPFPPSTSEHRYKVNNLQPETDYYWKIEAVGSGDINSESITQKFNTTRW